ncbi:unnamed protein product [Rotaria sp. Silwood2]|nr:unnamed protein product [Rotaria sp. Silwood2]CAF4601960.1 unnamed protein product [Rotaria sp. Silwood2]
MNSPLFSVNDVAAQARINRERRRKKRRDTYKNYKHLSNNIKPFKKRFKSHTKRIITQQLSTDHMYSELTHHSSFTKSSIPGEEVLQDVSLQEEINEHDIFKLNLNFSSQEESVTQSDDEFNFDQNSPFSSTNDEELVDSVAKSFGTSA